MVSEPMHAKSKGFPIDVPFYPYTFYMHSVVYKKQGAPDQRLILSLYFFTHVALRTKSKGLLIDVLFYPCTFYTCSVTGSRSMIIILFIYNQHQRMKSKGHLYIYHTTHLRYLVKLSQ
jgi:hypothetical protein